MLLELPKDDDRYFEAFQALSGLFQYNYLARMFLMGKHGVVIEIKPLEAHQSNEQRNYYHKWKRELAEYVGMAPDELHHELLCRAYGSEEVETKFGTIRRPMLRSSEAGRTDYSHLIETLLQTASEMGFVIPPPQRRLKSPPETPSDGF